MENSKGIPLTDLGAELHQCAKCGETSVLSFNWCSTCRERYEDEFNDLPEVPNFITGCNDTK